MLFHASVLAITILYVSFLEAVVFFPSATFLISLLALPLIFRSAWKLGNSSRTAIIPTFFGLSGVFLLFFVSSPWEQQVFILLGSLVFYSAALGIYRLRFCQRDPTAIGLLSLAAMATLFFLFSSLYGIFLNFRNFTPLLLMLSYGGVTFAVSFEVFSRLFPDDPKRIRLFAFLLAFFMAEIGWISTFWPFGYLTVGSISLILLFVPWDMIHRFSLAKNFSPRSFFFRFFVAFGMFFLVLFSTEWFPIV